MTNSKLSLLSISIVLPVLKSRCIITYTRVNFLKTGKGCNDVSVRNVSARYTASSQEYSSKL